ncbi:hypothetical protein FH972_017823 [Carpinus fangiana]|uniref:Uncharacterized protein n=1 Tax=Carpinus fangiana TaxID=176857 RepID=A0A5N6RNM0_9ROSI|nr:hypothetical protein FH972_017823 [Carpinus fangiana]
MPLFLGEGNNQSSKSKDAAEQVNAAIRVFSAKFALGAKNTNREERQGPGKS